MKADSIHLFDFLGSGKTIFEIPVFQRNYEWGEEQCRQLFRDLINAIKESRDHFLGAIVYVSETGNNMSHIYRIIDGQQRLTSLTLLLKALADVDKRDSEEIQEEYLTNKYLNENNHLKLKPVEHDLEAFNAVMSDNIQYENPSKIIENYNLFKDLIKESDMDTHDIYMGINHFTLVYIELNDNNNENPQVIFESLNSTGVSLSSSDLVRNFLLMKLESASQTELYKRYWVKIEKLFNTNIFTEFIRHYLIMKTHKLVKKDKVYDAYKEYYYHNKLDSEAALQDLYKFAIYYDQLLNSSTNIKEFNKVLDQLNILGSKVIFPYFMLLLNLYDEGQINSDYVVELANTWESLLFRIRICHMGTNRLNKIVISLCDIQKETNSLSQSMYKFTKATFPDDKVFATNLMHLDIYNQRKHLAKLALMAVEENRTKETIEFDDAQIEHIMPQHLNAAWRLQVEHADRVNEQLGNTIGNLTLTKYNQEMGNKPFAEKKKIYSESNISLTREIGDNYDSWNEDTIVERSKELIGELLKIFPMPKAEESDANSNEIVEYALDDNVNVTGRKPVGITIGDKDYSVEAWKQMLVIFLNSAWDADSTNLEKIQDDPMLDKILFGEDKKRPLKLKNGMTVESNFPAANIIALITNMASICGMSDQISYRVR
ncbi:DUF262 domain-containing protein [Lactobacillus amylovorus]|uniref:DUF262 domain-containing protein n=1 Tax=Lactobacillus amylovorus TaxID=1604 RepID=UPI003F9BFE50